MGDSKKVEIVEALPIKLAYEISKDDCQEELRNRVLNGEITSLADFMEQKKLKLSQIDEAQVVEESKDYSSILENDFKICNYSGIPLGCHIFFIFPLFLFYIF